MKKKAEVIISQDYLEELKLSNLVVNQEPSKNVNLWENKIRLYLSKIQSSVNVQLPPDVSKKINQFKTHIDNNKGILIDFILSPSFHTALLSVSERVQRGNTNGWALLLAFGWEMYKESKITKKPMFLQKLSKERDFTKKAWIISELNYFNSKEYRRNLGFELVRTASERSAGRVVVPSSVTEALDLQTETEKSGFLNKVLESFWKVLVKIWDKMSTVKIHAVDTSNKKRKFYDANGNLTEYPAIATFNIQKAFPMKKIMIAAILASGSIGALAGAAGSADGDKAKGGLLGALTGGGAGATGILTMMMMMNNSSTETFLKKKMEKEYGTAEAEADSYGFGKTPKFKTKTNNLAAKDLALLDDEDFLSHLNQTFIPHNMEGKDTPDKRRLEMLRAFLKNKGKNLEVRAILRLPDDEQLPAMENLFKEYINEQSEGNENSASNQPVLSDKEQQDKLMKELSKSMGEGKGFGTGTGREDKDKDRDIIGLALDLGSLGNIDMKYDDMTFYVSYQVTIAIGVGS